MTRAAALLLALACGWAQAQAPAAPGPALKRSANLPDGAPAFDVLDGSGKRVARIECLWNGWYEADALAARLLGSPAVTAAVQSKGARITIEDLGPGVFNCFVVVPAP